MTVRMIPVDSSHIKSVAHDPETNTFHIEFKSGTRGTHGNVSAEQFAAFMVNPSKGQAYAAMFRGRSGHPWTPAGREDGAAHEGIPAASLGSEEDEVHPLAHIEGIDDE